MNEEEIINKFTNLGFTVHMLAYPEGRGSSDGRIKANCKVVSGGKCRLAHFEFFGTSALDALQEAWREINELSKMFKNMEIK